MSSFQLQNSEVLARLKPFGISFEKSLSDLIKGLRAHSKESPESLSAFLDSAIMECKNELSTTDLETKAMAVLKLAYLEMYGFDMSWCNFQILEVMSSNKIQQKRIGYLAAIQSFKNEQDLLILATNQFKKDLNSHNHIEIGLALSGIATIVTPNLSKDINDDVIMKLNHSKPYIRKKAILAMYKIFLQYPESLRLNFNRVIEKLDDSDSSVVSATINVICEISKKNPNIFINYLPKFFSILEDTKNNWLIIRILKLFQSLSKVEPRMKKKILPTIMELMIKTQASSLIYECISCIVNGQMLSSDSGKDKETARICIERIMKFFETRDSNLKFVGLLALINILKIFPVFIHKIKGVSKVIMDCLTDNDLIIKRKALEVCHYLVTEDNITELIKVLLMQLIPNENLSIPEALKLEVTLKILSIASQENYSNIPNFKWYIVVLKDIINLTLLPLPSSAGSTISHSTADTIANEIGKEFKTLATRVPSTRSTILNKVIIDAVQDIKVLENCPSLLKDFYWILGEYIDELKILPSYKESDKEEDDDEEVEEEEIEQLGQAYCSVIDLGKKIQIFNTLTNQKLDTLLNLSLNSNFPISSKLITLSQTDVLVVLIQALVKLYNGIVTDYAFHYAIDGKIPHDKYVQLGYYLFKLINFFGNWENHLNYEVQERTLSWLEFLKLCLEAMTRNSLSEIEALQKEEVEYYVNLAKTRSLNDESGSCSNESYSDSESESEDQSEWEDEQQAPNKVDEGYESLVSSSNNHEDLEQPYLNEIDPQLQSNSFTSNLTDEPLLLSETTVAATEAISSSQEDRLPMLLTHILPSFFKSYQLNPISWNSQRKIPIPADLDLDEQINSPPFEVISEDEVEDEDPYTLFSSDDEDSIMENKQGIISSNEEGHEEMRKKKEERLERLKDDPYYITSSNGKKPKSKIKKVLMSDNEKRLSPDSYNERNSINSTSDLKKTKSKSKKLRKEKVLILSEETIDGINDEPEEDRAKIQRPKKKKNILKIDSSNLDNFELNSSSISDNASILDSNKDFEYNIDLNDLRNKLAESSIKNSEKKKSKKSKSKSSRKHEEKSKKKPKEENETVEAVPESNRHQQENNPPITTDNNVITVKRPKKSKKISKAVIIE